jgi:hypothetical protein
MIRTIDHHSSRSSAPQNNFRASVTNVENQYASVVKSSGRSRADLKTRQQSGEDLSRRDRRFDAKRSRMIKDDEKGEIEI